MQDSSQEHHGRAEPSQSSRRLDELRAVARELAGFAASKSALEAVLGHFPARLEAENQACDVSAAAHHRLRAAPLGA